MGILSRFGDIMRANINDLLTGAENKNAEKLLNQYLRDAREVYAQVKNETASVMAQSAAASASAYLSPDCARAETLSL